MAEESDLGAVLKPVLSQRQDHIVAHRFFIAALAIDPDHVAVIHGAPLRSFGQEGPRSIALAFPVHRRRERRI